MRMIMIRNNYYALTGVCQVSSMAVVIFSDYSRKVCMDEKMDTNKHEYKYMQIVSCNDTDTQAQIISNRKLA